MIDAKGNNSVVNRGCGDGILREVERAKGNGTKYTHNGLNEVIHDCPEGPPVPGFPVYPRGELVIRRREIRPGVGQ